MIRQIDTNYILLVLNSMMGVFTYSRNVPYILGTRDPRSIRSKLDSILFGALASKQILNILCLFRIMTTNTGLYTS